MQNECDGEQPDQFVCVNVHFFFISARQYKSILLLFHVPFVIKTSASQSIDWLAEVYLYYCFGLKSFWIHLHSDFIDLCPSGNIKKELVLSASNKYIIFSEYSVPFSITDETIIAVAHNSALVIKAVVEFLDFILYSPC